MARLSELDPYNYFVQEQMIPGKFASSEMVAIAMGPALLRLMSTAKGVKNGDVVFPIGIVQNFSLMQNMALARIFELGSRRAYLFPGKVVGAITFGRPYYHGVSMLRAIMAAYSNLGAGSATFNSVFAHNMQMRPDGTRHQVRIPPGYENLFLNLASDLFMQPHGELVVIKDTDNHLLGAMFFEQCYVPAHNFAVDAQGTVFQEGVQVQYERMVPLNVAALPMENPVRVFSNDKPLENTNFQNLNVGAAA